MSPDPGLPSGPIPVVAGPQWGLMWDSAPGQLQALTSGGWCAWRGGRRPPGRATRAGCSAPGRWTPPCGSSCACGSSVGPWQRIPAGSALLHGAPARNAHHTHLGRPQRQAAPSYLALASSTGGPRAPVPKPGLRLDEPGLYLACVTSGPTGGPREVYFLS